jgi:hypothetical protein
MPEIPENGRLSWQQLLQEAVTKSGTLHEAESRFSSYSLGNQILALMQCRARGIKPGPLYARTAGSLTVQRRANG